MSYPQFFNPAKCPLCGGPNACQLCSPAAYKGQCWCASKEIPDELLARVPELFRNRACICRTCVTTFHRAKTNSLPAPKILPGDFYFDGSLMVFTAEYHLRRGYCCHSNCRHCPWSKTTSPAFSA